MRAIPTAAASPAAWSASSSSRPTSTIGLLAVGEPGELGAEAGAQRGDADRAGDVRVVELQVGAHVDDQRARRRASLDLARRERVGLAAARPSAAPRLSATIASKFGGCGPSVAVAARTNSSSSVDLQQRVVRALEADRRGDLEVHPRPAAQRAAEVPGPHLGRRRAAPAAARAASGRCRARPPPFHRQVGPGDVADEQRVAGQHRPRLVAARGVDRARTRCARAGGRACAARARAARRAPAPSRRRTARGRSPAPASRWMWMTAPVAAASRPWPETWSAWLWVSRMCSIRTPR